ncbi:potassium/sodium hyperpolarization-activated cyclic nucleotide-gated channel 2 [Folsomia candida]|nr:potassium/sodium hyperpolarization-activated cyclic nucleotide-gated channel 2 [Folsomia candida]
MMDKRVILLLVTVGVVATMPNPQYGGGSYSGGGGSPSTGGGSGGAPAPNYASAGPAPQQAAPQPAAPAVAQPPPFVPSPSYSSSSQSSGSGGFVPSSGSAGGDTGSSGGAAGGNLQVQCKSQESSPGSGSFKFSCEGVDPSQISLRSEHILWLEGPNGQKQVIDVDIPNYKIEELIKAGFKPGEGQGTQINLKLKKPDQSYEAQKDDIKSQQGTPTVNLQYEPVQKTVAHFPSDKPYSPLQGPLLPPGGGSSGGSSGGGAAPSGGNRYYRQTVYTRPYNFRV